MNIVASRYARALLDALAPDSAPSGLEQLQRVQSLLEAEPDASKLLKNPVVPAERREHFIDAIGASLGLDSRVRKLVGLLVERRRLSVLPDIIAAYQKMLDERTGIVRAIVHAAGPLSGAAEQELAAKLEQSTGKRVVMEINQDPSLIGGIVVRMGSTVLDASVRKRLSGFKERVLAG